MLTQFLLLVVENHYNHAISLWNRTKNLLKYRKFSFKPSPLPHTPFQGKKVKKPSPNYSSLINDRLY